MIVTYNVGLKTFLPWGIFEPAFYDDLVYKFKRIAGMPSFNDQLKKITKFYKGLVKRKPVFRGLQQQRHRPACA